MAYYLQGLTMGLAFVAPIGLQNLFVINTALTQTKTKAYITALVVIFFDISLALACFFGVGTLMDMFVWAEPVILLAGSFIILYIGIGLLRKKIGAEENLYPEMSALKMVLTAGAVTWFNPQAIIDGTMLLGAFRAALPSEAATAFITGILSGSVLWFSGITTFILLFSQHFTPRILRNINLICGTILAIYSLRLLGIFFLRLKEGLFLL